MNYKGVLHTALFQTAQDYCFYIPGLYEYAGFIDPLNGYGKAFQRFTLSENSYQ